MWWSGWRRGGRLLDQAVPAGGAVGPGGAHLRRDPRPGPARGSRVRVGALQIDAVARRAYLGEVEIVLRAKEFDLLARLAAEPGAAITRSVLMADVWDANWFGSTKTLDVHMAALRRKLAAAAVSSGGAGTGDRDIAGAWFPAGVGTGAGQPARPGGRGGVAGALPRRCGSRQRGGHSSRRMPMAGRVRCGWRPR